jgi:predicted DNA-binding protein (UPF0251 family)/DNA-directed RNA polymerase subunit RPC12/RpoP
MPRQQKWRKVEFIPNIQHFIPLGISRADLEENILKIEEIEAMRLKDVEKLEQEDCAKRMHVSRQTFQRILGKAREKITDSIINGKAIRIEGGKYTRNICPVKCMECEKEWQESYENFEKILNGEYSCPDCGSKKIVCKNNLKQHFCQRNCWRRGRV